jgi:hypothetical protein
MWSEHYSTVVLFAQRPPPDWQNSFWSSPMGTLLILIVVIAGHSYTNRR